MRMASASVMRMDPFGSITHDSKKLLARQSHSKIHRHNGPDRQNEPSSTDGEIVNVPRRPTQTVDGAGTGADNREILAGG